MDPKEYVAEPLLRSCEREFEPPDKSFSSNRRWQEKTPRAIWFWIAQLVLATISFTALAVAWRITSGEQRCVDKLSSYSPVLEVIDDNPISHRFNGTITMTSKYKGPPTPERVDAWDELWDTYGLLIDHDTLLKLGAPENSVKAPPEYGDKYLATLEVYHYIHCVEELWKNTWPGHYNTDAGDEDSIFRSHLDHCADILRQKLMCDGDVTPMTQNWVKGLKQPTPNFNVLHKCRDFDAIKAWSKEHELFLPEEAKIPPDDAIILDDLP